MGSVTQAFLSLYSTYIYTQISKNNKHFSLLKKQKEGIELSPFYFAFKLNAEQNQNILNCWDLGLVW